ncbi:uncharacterized protein [Epargyreus clarus]|uniref:uncharacterized protein n=1 Tax=Epargyreus clarus TaxID=520877 RepID=UPI003C2EFB17
MDNIGKKIIRKKSRRPVSNIKLPPIEQNSDVKTIIDVDPDFYSSVEGRPIRPNLSIHKYKENIKNIALKRTLYGFLTDEILRINREMETERKIYETTSKHFEEYQYSFDKFLADDNNKTIAIMRKSDTLARDLVNETEEHKKANYELSSLKSKLQYIDESLQIMISFQTFLHRASPILWQQSQNINLVTENVEFFTMHNDIFCKIDKELIADKLKKLPPPCLYFKTPEQLLTIFGLLEKQNLNYLLVTEELNSEKNKFLKSLHSLKKSLSVELDYIQQKINEIKDVIAWNEGREIELKEVFFKILEEKIQYLVSSDVALQIFNYVEFAYEQLIAPNDTHLSSLEMTLSLEREYNNLMLDLSGFDLDKIKAIEKETYEFGAEEVKQAENASKLLRDVDKLSRRLKSSYEPSRKNIFN